MLIIQEDNVKECGVDVPDDNQDGGTITMDFSPPAEMVYSIGLLDVDYEVGKSKRGSCCVESSSFLFIMFLFCLLEKILLLFISTIEAIRARNVRFRFQLAETTRNRLSFWMYPMLSRCA